MIISAGYNIAGPEVEGALLSHPAVAECGVVGEPDDERGMVVKAFVVLRPGNKPDDEMKKNLQEHVKRNIAPYKYPREVEFVAALPRTETGKLQRFRLRTEGREHHEDPATARLGDAEGLFERHCRRGRDDRVHCGQVAFDSGNVIQERTFAGQFRQTLKNTLAVLAEAGGRPEHIVRMTWYITDKKEYLAAIKDVGAAYRELIGRHYPAMAVVQVVALMEDAAKVEIETTAVVP